jgi:large subunit ribosomal protein L6
LREEAVSRIGKKPVLVPPKVKVAVSGRSVSMEGPKGKISRDFRDEVAIALDDNQLKVTRISDEPFARAYHGTTRAHLANMAKGVSEGFERALDIVGVGYNAKVQGKKLVLQVGFSHPIEMEVPEGVAVEVPQPTRIVVKSVDKQKVGEFAARIRKVRPPEPYKGKGIRYENERIVKKAGKAFGSSE